MFPMNDPKFVILVSLDEPKGIAETAGYATAGMVAAPTVKTLIEDIVSLYGILPGDLKEGLPPIEIASTPVPAQVVPPQFVPANARHRAQEPRKALPAAARPEPDGGRTRSGSAPRCC